MLFLMEFDRSASDSGVFGRGQSGGSVRALHPSVGKLYTLQPFTWPGSLDKVRIVCQWAVMPGMLSAGSLPPPLCVRVSLTLYFATAAAVWIGGDTPPTPRLPQLQSEITDSIPLL